MVWGNNLANITAVDLPLLLVTDSPRSVFGFIIKVHQKGYCSHAMWLHRLDPKLGPMCASQGWTFKEVPLEKFKHTDYIKFWRKKQWSAAQAFLVKMKIARLLGRPWWQRRYDWLGILGHAVCIPGINIPFRHYCSESAGDILKEIEPGFKLKHPSPSDINRWCKEQEEEGYYVWDRWNLEV